ncbi:MAG: F0F1 ATP synthase subunit delta [Deltaproteobacteria bacterium]|nr:F0F1 ATP synthase subunit delta [Deltaproteobacteria bacterium]
MSDSRLSKRYAKALFGLGKENDDFGQYGQELTEFTDFCVKHEDFGQVIANPIFSVEDRKKVLKSILDKSGFSGMVMNFLNLLLDKNRIGAIEAITEHYARLTDEASNIARAEMITSRPLKGEALEKIVRSLEKLTSKKIEPDVREDRSLIGGVVVKIGDIVLDGSVKAQLEGLKESFKRGE